jgi:hypothetical protein
MNLPQKPNTRQPLFKALKKRFDHAWELRGLPLQAREQLRQDRQGLPATDPASEKVIEAAVAWLGRAQDRSASADGGVARDYSLIYGWSSSYPETTGYIIPTLLEYARRTGNNDAHLRAHRMLEWLKSIQMPSGAFQGGKIDSKPVVPVAFNTGQILLGLTSGEVAFGGYLASMRSAADWLVQNQDPDGCWRKHSSPFAGSGDKTYDTHIAWGLFEAARIDPTRGYGDAGLANVRWALTHQRSNGWVDKCCLDYSPEPLTHTLGYALRGIVEAYRFSRDHQLLAAARKTADGLLTAMDKDGFLPGRLAPDWSPTVTWSCLTGTVQIAICLMKLFEDTGDKRYWVAARRANSFVRRTVNFDSGSETAGAVRGSFPVNGAYGRFQYPNWPAKFLIDSLILEKDIASTLESREQQGHSGTIPPMSVTVHDGDTR